MKINGKVISGTHKGTYFMSLDVYKDQFHEKLGFDPFPGTLNILINQVDIAKLKASEVQDQMRVINGEGKFGDVKFIKATLNQKAEGALLFPVKTQHEAKILEFISPENLRQTLKLEDGDHATLTINQLI